MSPSNSDKRYNKSLYSPQFSRINGDEARFGTEVAPKPVIDLAVKENFQNQIREYKNAGIKNMITFLYLYDGGQLGLKLAFRSQKMVGSWGNDHV